MKKTIPETILDKIKDHYKVTLIFVFQILILIQYYDLKPSQLTDEMKIDHLVKVLALVQTSDKKPDPGPESESSERIQTDENANSPVLRKVEDEELTMVSTLKRRQSEQEVKISHES